MFNLGEKMEKTKATNLNPIVLAFVGDAVYSLFVREKLTFTSDSKSGELNKLATSEVMATAQADFVKEILPLLTEEELAIFKRARNAKKPTKAKHASVADYNNATGFEAVVGYLYIVGEIERLNFILNKGKTNES
jgi:ribonuclease-3 family protein